jgi:hypothetical protein
MSRAAAKRCRWRGNPPPPPGEGGPAGRARRRRVLHLDAPTPRLGEAPPALRLSRA